MSKARHARRGDKVSLMIPNSRVLAMRPLDDGFVSITLELEDSASFQFGDAGHVIEIIFKGGRRLSSSPYRRPGGGNGGSDPTEPAPMPGDLMQT